MPLTPLMMGPVEGPKLTRVFIQDLGLERSEAGRTHFETPLVFWVSPKEARDLAFFQSDPDPELPGNFISSMLSMGSGTDPLERNIRARMEAVNTRGMLLQMNVYGSRNGDDVDEFRICVAIGKVTLRLWTGKELRRLKWLRLAARILNALPERVSRLIF